MRILKYMRYEREIEEREKVIERGKKRKEEGALRGYACYKYNLKKNLCILYSFILSEIISI